MGYELSFYRFIALCSPTGSTTTDLQIRVALIVNMSLKLALPFSFSGGFGLNNSNMGGNDEDRKRRLRDLESKLRDPRSIINVDCLLDAVQSVVADCDHPAIRKIKNVDAFVSRCKNPSSFFV